MLTLQNRSKLFTVLVISALLHVVGLVIFGSYVLVNIITNEPPTFEAAPPAQSIKPPKKQYKVSLEKASKSSASPKLNPIVSKNISSINVPDVKTSFMKPDVNMKIHSLGAGGFTEDFGSIRSGNVDLGDFATIKLFGIESKGQKFFILLDATKDILVDERGGIPGYTFVKEKIQEVLNQLPDGVLFNVAVFDKEKVNVLSPNMLRATDDNKSRLTSWIDPINKSNFTGPMGHNAQEYDGIEPLKDKTRFALKALNEAMRQGCDTLFLLTTGWYHMGWYYEGDGGMQEYWLSKGYSQKEIDTYIKNREEDRPRRAAYNKKRDEFFKKTLAEENKLRASKGLPPRVIGTYASRDYIHNENGYPRYEENFKRLPAAPAINRDQYMKYVENLYQHFYHKQKKKAPPLNVVLFQTRGEKTDEQEFDQKWFRDLSRQSHKGKFDTVRLAEAIKRTY